MSHVANLKSMATCFNLLSTKLGSSRIISSDSAKFLKKINTYFISLSVDNASRGSSPVEWQMFVPPSEAITFKPSEIDSRLIPDIFCRISGTVGDEWKIFQMDTVFRLWSKDKSLSYRDGLDSESLLPTLEDSKWKRVILRLHFDLCEPKKMHPRYHFQIGGRQNDQIKENLWYPEKIDLPRILCVPIDLFTGIEMILANFYPLEYEKLSSDGNWRKIMKWSELNILRNEFSYLLKCINEGGPRTTYFQSLENNRFS